MEAQGKNVIEYMEVSCDSADLDYASIEVLIGKTLLQPLFAKAITKKLTVEKALAQNKWVETSHQSKSQIEAPDAYVNLWEAIYSGYCTVSQKRWWHMIQVNLKW